MQTSIHTTAVSRTENSWTWRCNSEQPQPIMPFGIVAYDLMLFQLDNLCRNSCIRNLSSCEKKAWKKIQAWTGFEPMTSAIPVQCSTNWAIKPTGSWSLCEFVIYPLRRWDESEYMKIHTFELRNKEWISELIIAVIFAT